MGYGRWSMVDGRWSMVHCLLPMVDVLLSSVDGLNYRDNIFYRSSIYLKHANIFLNNSFSLKFSNPNLTIMSFLEGIMKTYCPAKPSA